MFTPLNTSKSITNSSSVHPLAPRSHDLSTKGAPRELRPGWPRIRNKVPAAAEPGPPFKDSCPNTASTAGAPGGGGAFLWELKSQILNPNLLFSQASFWVDRTKLSCPQWLFLHLFHWFWFSGAGYVVSWGLEANCWLLHRSR